ncbi:MAG: tetratricopeptide repeat protein [Trichlorobacter sp.]|jgi:cytochrome c-type biogenesis protein CcmH/NrfG|nr:tetratricopeptide repeat protein [Trichlorobacter sp.]
MNKENIIFGMAGLIIGLLIGIMVSGKSDSSTAHNANTQHATTNTAQLNTSIAEFEAIVAKDAGNLQAWISLGNAYFDVHNPQKAVQAYEKALEINPDNPDVLTDQGVMLRELGFFDRALGNFQKANKLNPQHLQSLFNQGIVYNFDLHQPEKARAVLEQLISQNPSSPMAQQARGLLEQLGQQ